MSRYAYNPFVAERQKVLSQTFDIGFVQGREAGRMEQVYFNNAVIGPHQARLYTALTGYESAAKSLVRLANIAPGARRELVGLEMKHASDELVLSANAAKNTLAEMAKVGMPEAGRVAIMSVILETLSDLQDGVAAYLTGDDGQTLRQFAISRGMPEKQMIDYSQFNLGGNPGGMTPANQWLAERLLYYREQQYRRGWWRCGFAVFKDIIGAYPDLKTMPEYEKNAFFSLSIWVSDDHVRVVDTRAMGDYCGQLVRRFKQYQEQMQPSTG